MVILEISISIRQFCKISISIKYRIDSNLAYRTGLRGGQDFCDKRTRWWTLWESGWEASETFNHFHFLTWWQRETIAFSDLLNEMFRIGDSEQDSWAGCAWSGETGENLKYKYGRLLTLPLCICALWWELATIILFAFLSCGRSKAEEGG